MLMPFVRHPEATSFRPGSPSPERRASTGKNQPQHQIVIVGGGEFLAELRNTAQVLGAYGMHHLNSCARQRRA